MGDPAVKNMSEACFSAMSLNKGVSTMPSPWAVSTVNPVSYGLARRG
jgi:hypothetical protein